MLGGIGSAVLGRGGLAAFRVRTRILSAFMGVFPRPLLIVFWHKFLPLNMTTEVSMPLSGNSSGCEIRRASRRKIPIRASEARGT